MSTQRQSAPFPIEDLSPFVYREEGKAEGFYYIPQIENNSTGYPQAAGVLTPISGDTTLADDLQATNPPAGTSIYAPNAQSPAPSPNAPTQPVSTSQPASTQQSISSFLDNITGVASTNPTSTIPTTINVSTVTTAINQSGTEIVLDSNGTQITNAVINNGNILTNSAGDLTDINGNLINSAGGIINKTNDNEFSGYAKPIIIGGVAGMLIAKIAKKDIFWGFVFGAGALSIYKHYRVTGNLI